MRNNGVTAREILVTGAHRNSVALVRSGQADIAAIDAHTWSYLDSDGVDIVEKTDPVPAPPYVTRQQDCRNVLLRALQTAAEQCGGAIGVEDVIESSLDDYAWVGAESGLSLTS